jgi:hypothetical protein
VDSSLLAALVNKHFATSQAFDFFTVALLNKPSQTRARMLQILSTVFKNPRLRSHQLTVDPWFCSAASRELQ